LVEQLICNSRRGFCARFRVVAQSVFQSWRQVNCFTQRFAELHSFAARNFQAVENDRECFLRKEIPSDPVEGRAWQGGNLPERAGRNAFDNRPISGAFLNNSTGRLFGRVLLSLTVLPNKW
jgi:hypothetical protein